MPPLRVEDPPPIWRQSSHRLIQDCLIARTFALTASGVSSRRISPAAGRS